MTIVPRRNVTVPVGLAPAEVTTALNVTLAPNNDGFSDAVRTVAVAAGVTVCVRTGDVAARNAALPPYATLTVVVPALKTVVVNVAIPPDSARVNVPRFWIVKETS